MRQVRFLLKGKHSLSSTHPIQNLVGFVEEEDIGKLVAAILAPSDNTTTYFGQTINGISELAKPTDMIERFQSVIPDFSPHYKHTSPTFMKYLFKFLSKVVGGPVFPYIGAIMENFGESNALDMDMNDVKKCQEMTAEFGGLTTFEVCLLICMSVDTYSHSYLMNLQHSLFSVITYDYLEGMAWKVYDGRATW